MKLFASLAMLACSVTAADITIVVTPSSSNVTITITVPAASVATVATNEVVVQQQAVAAVAVTPPSTLPDARSTTPRAIPMPPMPPAHLPLRVKDWSGGNSSNYTWKTITVDAPWFKPLPGGTNRTYSEHQAWMAERAARGLRRSE